MPDNKSDTIDPGMMDKRNDMTIYGCETALAQQEAAWPAHLKGAKEGNPFATLCRRCYGRHAPPRDEICDKEAPHG